MDENAPLTKPLPAKDKTPEQIATAQGKFFRMLERVAFGVIIMAILTAGYYYRQAVNKEHAIKKVAIELLTDSKEEAITKVVALTEVNKILVEKLERLKTKEGLAKRDLEEYILKKYRVVPKVVAKEVATQVVNLTKEEGVPFSMLVGLIEVESQFKPWAVSKKDARGLMQVMPFWVTNKKVDLGLGSKYDLHDIESNIRAGIAVFKVHLGEANNDINQALYLYVGKDRTYANKVFNAMGRFEIFRSTLDTTLRDEKDQENGEVQDKSEEAPVKAEG